MKYLEFDRSKLTNLEYSTHREFLRSNRAGSYASSTIVGCNTRKYHGLLISPVESCQNERFVFLSTLDESIIQREARFNLGIHKYGEEVYCPKGHKYVIDFETDYVTKITYRVGGVVLSKEFLMTDMEEQVLIKYTLEEAHSPTLLRLQPFLANRLIHSLSHANLVADTRIEFIENGIRSQMYKSLPALYLQLSKKNDFVPVPDWYYGIEYAKEQERGYDYKEDLFVPGYFEFPIRKGESVYFSASLQEHAPEGFSRKYAHCLSKRIPRDSFENCLKNAAQQFFVRKGHQVEVLAGFPWFGSWGRDTFIALPGLTLSVGDIKTCKEVIDTMVGRMKGGLFPNMGSEDHPAFNSVDAPLWFFQALQEYAQALGDSGAVWRKYKKPMKAILEGFREGLPFNIHLDENGLIWQGESGKALTWMDAVVDGIPVTPRAGYAVEINLLWYNAVCWSLALAEEAGERKFVSEWKYLPELTRSEFMRIFWNEEKGYLADCHDGNSADWSVRPNQVFAASLMYSPLSPEQQKMVLDKVGQKLLTPRGLRTLSPSHPDYKGTYNGNQKKRDAAYHQGTVWPWLLEPYAKGWLKFHKKGGLAHIKNLVNGFEEEITWHGVGSISEIYNGDPPHHGRGAISQAWSVGALLSIMKMIKEMEKEMKVPARRKSAGILK
ncbi:MAG: amylo-alpha-1,6-glucosidase [Bacteroidales bacterium]|nr:amylo-alpha-1,6-glucosidase [Bacteroidales bacterium]